MATVATAQAAGRCRETPLRIDMMPSGQKARAEKASVAATVWADELP
jgi:hypothetical protein